MDDAEQLLRTLIRHRGLVAGAIAGLFLGWLLIRFGLGKTLILLAFGVAGALVGSRWDGGTGLGRLLDRLRGWQ